MSDMNRQELSIDELGRAHGGQGAAFKQVKMTLVEGSEGNLTQIADEPGGVDGIKHGDRASDRGSDR